MGFRITTNMTLNTYRYNLMNSTNKLTKAMDKVLTQRNFNSYAEDPASASQAFRLRREWWQTQNQLTNNDSTYNKFHTGWTNLGGIITDLSDANARVSAIRGNNGTAGESRTALAQVLRETAESVVQAMNQKVGEQFIFAGNDGLTVPFSWDNEHGRLFYRGVDVNAGSVPEPDPATQPQWMKDAINNKQTDEFGVPSLQAREDAGVTGALTDDEKAWLEYYNDQADLAKLQKMAKEELNIDLGMGLQEINGQLVNGSAFNTALCGVEFLGFGKDEDGDPLSLPLVMKELANVFETWGENGQKYLPEKYRDMSAEEIKSILKDPNRADEAAEINSYHEEMEAKAFRLMDKLNAAQEHTTEKYVELDARSSFLKTNSTRLSTQATNLNEQVLDIEQVDLADAISQLSWDKNCYNAALKIGNQLLSQSLIDYMN